MLSTNKSTPELVNQRTKLANSYTALFEEFASKDLRSVGNYQLGNLIGKGSFGKVYLAHHKLTNGSKVVLKSANKDDANLAREIHHHRQFLHPHIARLYEVIVTETLVWLVLEYCPGDELYYYLTQHGALDPSMVQKIFTQLVGAVSYVHSKSCVHRDLKLENILLDKNQNVKLCDFGFTREYEGKSNYLQTWCGTVCYSAPEMLKGEKYAGEKVDVWSLGIILYALLCGELPFDEEDETQTKMRILKEEPKYPDYLPTVAKDLINSLLSKRPLLRPSLADILQNSWLSEHAPQQQAILKVQQPSPFTTQLEKDTLERLRMAGVNIDMVIENVLSQRCDSLAGWWALLMEKEDRKAKRRERKRKEKEAETKIMRRISGASGRLERIAPTIKESDEEASCFGDRGREKARANGSVSSTSHIHAHSESTFQPRAPSIHHAHVRSMSNPRRRSQVVARDYNKRNSQLSVMAAANPELINQPKKRKRRYQQPLLSHLVSIKSWFKDSAKRARSPNPKQNNGLLHPDSAHVRDTGGTKQEIDPSNQRSPSSASQAKPNLAIRTTNQNRPRVSTATSTGSTRRHSTSPSPLTPTSSYRRGNGGNLRGRKSTSSSVSSVRSMPAHHASLSVGSSASSNSAASPSLSVRNSNSRRASPNLSTLKVLPKTPTSSSFPNDVRYVRSPPALNLSESNAAFSGAGPSSPGLVFAKRRRTPFRGPILGPGASSRRRSPGGSGRAPGSRSGSVQGRGSGEIIEEEEEDEIEEVDAFSPIEASEGAEGLVDFPRVSTTFEPPEVPGEERVASRGSMVEEGTLKALERAPSDPS
ncbi:MAG: hypothetical protein M1831_004803 [Alyxoria varia]|nr:MAG: hypothetical protein M1831_004803 [Alyxoria varia]